MAREGVGNKMRKEREKKKKRTRILRDKKLRTRDNVSVRCVSKAKISREHQMLDEKTWKFFT